MNYEKPRVITLSSDTETANRSGKPAGADISMIAILGCVQEAYEDAGLPHDVCVEVKQKLLTLAGEGDARRLIYHAVRDVLQSGVAVSEPRD